LSSHFDIIVLEKNPPKQGLKLEAFKKCCVNFVVVLEKNPPKQGLKRKTNRRDKEDIEVLEKNPPKQGLKHSPTPNRPNNYRSFREKSTKTRIETLG